MYEIKCVDSMNFKMVKDFLKEVPDIEQIDDVILANASILFDENKVSGIISYEAFFNYALIRYFVFKRNVTEEVVKELFASVLERVNKEKIEYIFSLVNQEDIYNLFIDLEFKEVLKENVFIEEECYSNSKFKYTKLMIRSVN